ncbi:MAG: hypothetical protein WAW23_03395 [Candidatus Methanoperedens sp.]
MKIVFYCLAQEKAGLAMAMERNVLSLITISLNISKEKIKPYKNMEVKNNE